MTAQRTRFEVTPGGEGWAVKRDGLDPALASFKHKDGAIDYANKMARVEQPSQVTVKADNGSIESEESFDGEPSTP